MRVLTLGNHCIEFLANGSVDIVDATRSSEYIHLDADEAYFLFAALYEKFKQS